MTTIVRNDDIPQNINTLERLIVHSISALKATVGGATFNLDGTNVGGRTPYVTITMGEASGDGELYFQSFVYIPLNPQIKNNGLNQRPWMYAEEISNNPYPSGYRLS
ncbi:hypothetical protein [Microcystis sp. LE19-195.1E]|uniref:hypothetical protein n=1 Tax=Microcystis sp. LE19-195.1E TaxID=3016440 RepID=UPI0022BCE868|nr:hypothetical protein [Microcystis sp. LE19-195.1E]MCZ8249498.1 hypothetical protein [Microcystis sp. LE19-195.1E]